MNFNNNQIQKILNIYKGIYIIILEFLTLILAIILNSISPINRIPETIILMLIPVIVSIYLYYGIKHKKPWLVPAMLYVTGITLLGHLLFTSSVAKINNQAFHLILVTLQLVTGIWQIFTLYFFTRKEVKNYFKDSRTMIV